MTSRRALLTLPMAAASAALAAPARAGERQCIQLLLPSAPGGGNWLLAASLAETVGPRIGRCITPVSRPSPRGAGYGIEALLRAAPDGETLGFAQTSHVLLPLAFPGLAFQPTEDFEPVAGWSRTPMALLVRHDSPVRDVRELFALLRAEPGRHRYASGGPASGQTLATEQLLRAGGVLAGVMHFPGSGPARAALAAGRVSFVLEMLPTALEAAAATGLRLVALAASERAAATPWLPTFAESSGLPSLACFDLDVWSVLLAPPGTPHALLETLHQAVCAAQADPRLAARLAGLGSASLTLPSRAAVRDFLRAERRRLETQARRLDHG